MKMKVRQRSWLTDWLSCHRGLIDQLETFWHCLLHWIFETFCHYLVQWNFWHCLFDTGPTSISERPTKVLVLDWVACHRLGVEQDSGSLFNFCKFLILDDFFWRRWIVKEWILLNRILPLNLPLISPKMTKLGNAPVRPFTWLAVTCRVFRVPFPIPWRVATGAECPRDSPPSLS